MKKLFLLFATVTVLVGVQACNQKTEETAEEAAVEEVVAVADSAVDAVAAVADSASAAVSETAEAAKEAVKDAAK